jgi:hypothetical protein
LEGLFKKYRTDRFDPASPIPGFELPAQVQVTWVTSDPKSEFFRTLAQVMTTLEIAPPLVYSPGWPGLGQALEHTARDVAWKTVMLEKYEKQRRQKPLDYEYLPLTEPFYALSLYGRLFDKPTPALVAAMVGASVPSGLLSAQLVPAEPTALYLAAAYQERAGKLDAVLKEEADRRLPVGVTLLLSGTDPLPLTPINFYHAASEDQFLPFQIVGPQFREQVEHHLAVGWAREVMKHVRDELDKHKGNGIGMRLRLEELQKHYGNALEVRFTAQARNRHDIADDPSMKAFLQAFEKSRVDMNINQGTGGTEKMLKEDDFYRLFFGSEPFSVGNLRTYEPRIWPPVVDIDPKRPRFRERDEDMLVEEEGPKTRDLWVESESPILFWKTDYRQEKVPDTLAAVHAQVEEAWRIIEARKDLALPRAQEIARRLASLQKKDEDSLAAFYREAKELGTKLITLDGVTPLVPVVRRELVAQEWTPFQLPRGVIPFPTADMTRDLLALRDLKEPIQISLEKGEPEKVPGLKEVIKRLNETNKELFAKDLNDPAAGLKGQFPPRKFFQVQILTNRPRTVFYIAAVTREHRPSDLDFLDAWSGAGFSQLPRKDPDGRRRYGDTLVDQAQEQGARAFQTRFMEQLRREANLEITDRSAFEKEGGSS